MDDLRVVKALLDIEFSAISDENLSKFESEFFVMSGLDEDPLNEWLKRVKSRGETRESDQILLTLLVELHKKVDELSSLIKNEKTQRLELDFKSQISAIGFGCFRIDGEFELNQNYYARVFMPVFPRREIAIFFKITAPNLAQIYKIHENDEKDWNAYIMARERILIREMKNG